jgi:hypothetical protein
MKMVVPSQLHLHFVVLNVFPGTPRHECSKLCRMLISQVAYVPAFRPDLALVSNTSSRLVLKDRVAARLMFALASFFRATYATEP